MASAATSSPHGRVRKAGYWLCAAGAAIVAIPVLTVLFILGFLAPIGLVLAMAARRRPKLRNLGIVLVTVGIVPFICMLPYYPVLPMVCLWQFDALRGWSLRLTVEAPPYTVVLIQEPHVDFYRTYFLIITPDGRTAEVEIDCDDYRWFNPGLVTRNGKTYFVRNFGGVDEETSYVDPANGLVYAGYTERSYRMADLDFANPQDPSRQDAPARCEPTHPSPAGW